MMMDRKWGFNRTNLILLVCYLIVLWILGRIDWFAAPEGLILFIGYDFLFAWWHSHSLKKRIKRALKLPDPVEAARQVAQAFARYYWLYPHLAEHLLEINPDPFGNGFDVTIK